MNDLPTRRAFNRAGAALLEQQISNALDHVAADKAAQHAQAKAASDQDKARGGTITREQLARAGAGEKDILFAPSVPVQVRDASGWHKVLRLNAKSVTVPGPWGGTRTIRIDRLRELRP